MPPPNWVSNCASPRPKDYQPSPEILQRAGGKIIVTDDVQAAARGADLLYTDVWVSMGKEAESAERIKQLTGYQSTGSGQRPTRRPGHALPARVRGKEIDEATFEANAKPSSTRPKTGSTSKRPS